MVRKFFELIKIILLLRFTIFKPKKKVFLLFDNNHKNFLLKYIKIKDLDVLYIRKEKVNLYILISNLLKFKLSFQDYIEAYIDCVSPKFIITFSDNSTSFFLIKKRKFAKKILIQNGWKNKYNDTFLNINEKNFHSDYAFVFNQSIGEIYKKILKSKIYLTGSFKSNCYEVNFDQTDYKIIFISAYRDIEQTKIMSDNITYKEYDLTHQLAVKKLSAYAQKKNIKLHIYGNNQFEPDKEKDYFRKLQLGDNWEFIKNDRSFTYKILNKTDLVVGTHSTLVYEAIGRGCKVFVFSKNLKSSLLNTHKFGWPYDFEKEGFFWTSDLSDSYILNNKLDQMVYLNKSDWIKKTKEIREKLMYFKLNNKEFQNLIESD